MFGKKPLSVRRTSHGLPQVWTEDGETCAADRVFNGYASLFAAAPELLDVCEAIVGGCIPVGGPNGLRAMAVAAIEKANAS
jgi:hypothetical protein